MGLVWQGQGMLKVKSLERSSSSRPWFGKQDRAQMQQALQEKDALIEALQVRLHRPARRCREPGLGAACTEATEAVEAAQGMPCWSAWSHLGRQAQP